MYYYSNLTPKKGLMFKSKKSPNELYLGHLKKYYLLVLLQSRSNCPLDKIQINNELVICQRKLKYHYSQEEFSISQCERDTNDLKRQWQKVRVG